MGGMVSVHRSTFSSSFMLKTTTPASSITKPNEIEYARRISVR